jgi:hypothetical protein
LYPQYAMGRGSLDHMEGLTLSRVVQARKKRRVWIILQPTCLKYLQIYHKQTVIQV